MAGHVMPTLTKLSETNVCTKWKMQFPSTIRKQGATYLVTTYPNITSIFVETWVKHKPVHGTRIIAMARHALSNAA